MEALARLNPGTRGLDELADRLDARELRDSMVFVVTLKESARNADAVRMLSQYCPVVKQICVTGPDFTRYVTVPEKGPETAGAAKQAKAAKEK
jgi:hypothetical protein